MVVATPQPHPSVASCCGYLIVHMNVDDQTLPHPISRALHNTTALLCQVLGDQTAQSWSLEPWGHCRCYCRPCISPYTAVTPISPVAPVMMFWLLIACLKFLAHVYFHYISQIHLLIIKCIPFMHTSDYRYVCLYLQPPPQRV